MKWLIFLAVAVLLLGPLRKWAGRHWAYLVSVTIGTIAGLAVGAWHVRTAGAPAHHGLLFVLVFALGVGHGLPGLLREIEKDGKK